MAVTIAPLHFYSAEDAAQLSADARHIAKHLAPSPHPANQSSARKVFECTIQRPSGQLFDLAIQAESYRYYFNNSHLTCCETEDYTAIPCGPIAEFFIRQLAGHLKVQRPGALYEMNNFALSIRSGNTSVTLVLTANSI